MNACVVFAGPSLPPAARPAAPHVVWYPPARRGDLAALDLPRGSTVILIDGYLVHDHPPSPTEVYELACRGHDVRGCASLGALRAAELRHHGVRGSGWVYERVVDRTVTDDDELVAPLDPRTGEATGLFLVNLRYGLMQLRTAGFVDPATADGVLTAWREVHFEHRTADECRERALTAGLTGQDVERLLAADIKRRDARALVRDVLSEVA